MRISNKKYSSPEDLYQNLNLTNLDSKRTLIQIFSGFIAESEIKRIQSIFKEKNSEIAFIGTTTAGEIFNGEAYEHSILVSILEFEETEVRYGFFGDENDYETGVQLARTLFTDKTRVAILFADALNTNGSDLADGISSENPDVPIVGGLAGDNGNLASTFIFNNDGVYCKGVVAAVLNSDKLKVFMNYHLNWQPIGQVMTVTKARKNRLFEIDGRNISDVYTEYLGTKVGENLPHSAIEFPLICFQDRFEICRTFVHQFDDGSLLTLGNLEVGDKVRFSFGNVDLILNDIISCTDNYYSYDPEVVFIYSCTARKTFLQSDIDIELKQVNRLAPCCGFFSYGEFFHRDRRNMLLNLSLTLLMLTEKSSSSPRNKFLAGTLKGYQEKNFFKNKHFLVLDALIHLSNKVIHKLEEVNRELCKSEEKLKELANRDYLTNLYNRRYFNEIATLYFKNAKREKNDISIIVLDIDRFKIINDTYGHNVGDEVIKDLSALLMEHTRECDLVARFGGEEFAILMPFTSKDGAIRIAERIRSVVESHEITVGNAHIKFTISLGVDYVDIEKDLSVLQALDRADIALYAAKNGGRNRVVAN